MKHVWVLGIRTSLPEICEGPLQETKYAVFGEFAAARDAMREAMRGFAFSKNAMFDGDGCLVQLLRHREGMWVDDDPDFLGPEIWDRLSAALRGVFAGEDRPLQGFRPRYEEWDMIAADFEEDRVSVYGIGDGPCNGYDPVIRTNCFSMREEQDYYLYLNDLFGQDEASAELYIELRRVELQAACPPEG